MVKRITALLIGLCLLFGLCGCGQKAPDKGGDDRYMKLYRYIVKNGEQTNEGVYAVSTTSSDNSALFYFMADTSEEGKMAMYCYTLGVGESSLKSKDLIISMNCVEKKATFQAEIYTEIDFDGKDAVITTTGSGALDMATFTSATQIALSTYESTTLVDEIEYTDTQIANADTEQLQLFICDALGYAAQFLQELDLGVNITDLGFEAWK